MKSIKSQMATGLAFVAVWAVGGAIILSFVSPVAAIGWLFWGLLSGGAGLAIRYAILIRRQERLQQWQAPAYHCGYCGQPIVPNVAYCSACGTAIQWPAAQQPW
jgi:hypothetical protein